MKAKTNIIKYKLTGRCNPKKCNAFCCRIGIGILINKKNIKEKDYCECFGLNIKRYNKKSFIVYSPIPCRFLDQLKMTCRIHKKKPLACREFPVNKNHDFYKFVKKYKCTYNFVKVKK